MSERAPRRRVGGPRREARSRAGRLRSRERRCCRRTSRPARRACRAPRRAGSRTTCRRLTRRCRPPSQPTGAAAREQHRQRVVIVLIRVRHAAAVHDHRVVEQAAVAVGRVRELAQEIRDRRPRVVFVELREPLDVRGNLGVVRRVVESLVHAALRIQPVAELARHHERGDAREVARTTRARASRTSASRALRSPPECRSACRAPRRSRAWSPLRARAAARARARRKDNDPCARGPRLADRA